MSAPGMKIVWHWFSMGPYHFARMAAVARMPGVELTVVENTSQDDHQWSRSEGASDFRVVTLSREPLSAGLLRRSARDYAAALDGERPDVVVECGYSDRRSCGMTLRYAHDNPAALALFWSESAAFDHPRSWWRESSKTMLIRQFDGALCAGTPHMRYLRRLGMAEDRIAVAGGSVDNALFAGAAERARGRRGLREELGLPERYAVYVGRFVPQKNLERLLEAYRMYRPAAGPRPMSLVLLGSGPEEDRLRAAVARDRIEGVVFAGVKQISELPVYYALADCLVLPSTSEPWGLVVNEALACGVPVLVSDRCGCAEDLVVNWKNGFVFNPYSADDLAHLLIRMGANDAMRPAMSAAAKASVAEFDARLFGERSVRHIRNLHVMGARKDRGGAASRLIRNVALSF